MKTFLLFMLVVLVVIPDVESQGFGDRVQTANNLYDQKQYQKAASLYKEQLTTQPGNLIIQYNFGNASFKSGNYNEAIDAFKKAVQSREKQLAQQAYYNLGVALAKRQRLTEAAEAFESALLLNNGDRAAKENLQIVLNLIKNQTASQNHLGQNDIKPTIKGHSLKKNSAAHSTERMQLLSSVQKAEEKTIENQRLKARGRDKEKIINDW